MSSHIKTISIIGCGKLGRTLGRLLHESRQFELLDVLNRTPASSREAVAFIGAGKAVASMAELRSADVYLIGTPDDQIGECCAALAACALLGTHTVVFHCSGALTTAALDAASRNGAAVASIHPIRSFASPERIVHEFSGTWCGAEGDSRAIGLLEPVFSAIGCKLSIIDASKKTLYHAAAVFACNYLVTLQDVAQQLYAAAGVAPDTALRMMEPLVRETVDNVFRLGPATALTGPVARGDTATVERQQQAVEQWNRACGKLYHDLAIQTAGLAARRN